MDSLLWNNNELIKKLKYIINKGIVLNKSYPLLPKSSVVSLYTKNKLTTPYSPVPNYDGNNIVKLPAGTVIKLKFVITVIITKNTVSVWTNVKMCTTTYIIYTIWIKLKIKGVFLLVLWSASTD